MVGCSVLGAVPTAARRKRCGTELGMVSSAAMRTNLLVVVLLGISALRCVAADKAELQERRQRAAAAFHDGILLVHAKPRLDIAGDGFRQDAAFLLLHRSGEHRGGPARH